MKKFESSNGVWFCLLCFGFLQSASHAALSLSIMPLGDSITAGLVDHSSQADRTSYRPWLWDSIQNRADVISGDLSVDFVGINSLTGVGSLNGQGANPVLNPAHPSHDPSFPDANSGTRGFATFSFDNSQLASHNPDIVLLMLGTNDIINAEVFGNLNLDQNEIDSARDNLIAKIDAFRGVNPDVSVMLGTVPPMYYYVDPDQTDVELGGYAGPDDASADTDGDGSWELRYEGDEVAALNAMIRTLGSGGSNDQSVGDSIVTIVDHELGNGNGAFQGNPGLPGSHSIDGVHPSQLGDQLLADNWYLPLSAELSSRVAAAAVPEPTAFAFLGLIAVVGGFTNRLRKAPVVQV